MCHQYAEYMQSSYNPGFFPNGPAAMAMAGTSGFLLPSFIPYTPTPFSAKRSEGQGSSPGGDDPSLWN